MKRSKSYLVGMLALIVVVGLAAFFVLSGDKQSENVMNKDTIVVGMELKFPPFETIDEQGNPMGVSVELAQLIGQKIGKNIEIKSLDWAGLIPALQSQQIDLIISSMSKTEEREETIDFSDDYAHSDLTLAIYTGIDAQGYEDLNEDAMIIAVKQGTTGEMWARKYLPNATVKTFTEVSAGLLDVNNGQSHAFIYDPLTLIESTKNMSNIRLNTEGLPGTTGWGIGMRKGQDELKAAINKALVEIKEEGFYEDMREKYLKEDVEKYQSYGLKYFF